MSTKIIQCPSGLTGEIRNLKAKEMSILASPTPQSRGKNARVSHPLDPIYQGCWLKTVDPGPYEVSEASPIPWGKVLVCDRFYALIHIRDLTWGPYEFKVRCINGGCRHTKTPFVWEIDINQLPSKTLPDASVKKLKAGDRVFTFELGGRECSFRLLTGDDEANAFNMRNTDITPAKRMLATVAARIFQVEGIDNDDADARADWVGELDLQDLYRAHTEMDKVDGGVEVRTKVECPECGEAQTVDIPFGETAFLAPTPK